MPHEVIQNLASFSVTAIFLINLIPATLSAGKTLSCETNLTGLLFDMEKLAGDWYEAARAPRSEVPACVKITAPKNISGNYYILELEYMNNVNKRWKHVKESLSFPWDGDTKKGFFNLCYGGGDAYAVFTYKLVLTNYIEMALLCGQTSVSPIPLLKVLTRKRHPPQSVKDGITQIAQKFGIESEMTSVYQSDRCVGAMKPLPAWTIFFVMFFQILQRF